MTDKVTLAQLGSIQNDPTAVATINANMAAITAAMDNTLSRDGTSPNTMGSNFDMNSFQILNLPAPATNDSPLRLTDLNNFIGGGTVTSIPAGGNTGDALVKNSGTDFDVEWSPNTADVSGGTNISVSGSNPTTINLVAAPTTLGTNITGLPVSTGISGLATGVATFLATPTSANLISAVTDETGSGALVFSTSPTLVTPLLGTPTSGVLTNCTGTASGLTAGTVTTNANLTGVITSSGNATSIASQTGTGTKFVVDTSPTIILPTISFGTSGSFSNIQATSANTGAANALYAANSGTLSNSSTQAQVAAFLTTSTYVAITAIGGATPSATLTTGSLMTGGLNISAGGGGPLTITSPTLTTPNIGVATGTSLTATAAILSSGTAGVGYSTGAGGTVVQATNRTTGVTINKTSGSITLFSQINAAVSAATASTMIVTNSTVAATDTISVSQKSGTDKYMIFVTAVGSNTFSLTYFTTGGTTNEAPVFTFNVIKGVTS